MGCTHIGTVINKEKTGAVSGDNGSKQNDFSASNADFLKNRISLQTRIFSKIQKFKIADLHLN